MMLSYFVTRSNSKPWIAGYGVTLILIDYWGLGARRHQRSFCVTLIDICAAFPQMVPNCDVAPAERSETPASPRGVKRNYSSIVSAPGSGGCAPVASRCVDWRRRRRQESGSAPAPAADWRQEVWAGPPAAAGRCSVIRSGTLTELPPAAGAALTGPAGFTPPASVSPQEPPPACRSPLEPELAPCGSPASHGPAPGGSPASQGPSPVGQPLCDSPSGPDPAPADSSQRLHGLYSLERPPIEAIRSFWYAP